MINKIQKNYMDHIKRWTRFVIGGLINTGFTYIVYLLLNTIINYQAAFLIAYALGIVFSYWFNAKIVFKVPLSWKQFFAYPLVYVIQYFLSALLLSFFVEKLKFSESISPLLVTIVLFPVTYLMSQLILKYKINNNKKEV